MMENSLREKFSPGTRVVFDWTNYAVFGNTDYRELGMVTIHGTVIEPNNSREDLINKIDMLKIKNDTGQVYWIDPNECELRIDEVHGECNGNPEGCISSICPETCSKFKELKEENEELKDQLDALNMRYLSQVSLYKSLLEQEKRKGNEVIQMVDKCAVEAPECHDECFIPTPDCNDDCFVEQEVNVQAEMIDLCSSCKHYDKVDDECCNDKPCQLGIIIENGKPKNRTIKNE